MAMSSLHTGNEDASPVHFVGTLVDLNRLDGDQMFANQGYHRSGQLTIG